MSGCRNRGRLGAGKDVLLVVPSPRAFRVYCCRGVGESSLCLLVIIRTKLNDATVCTVRSPAVSLDPGSEKGGITTPLEGRSHLPARMSGAPSCRQLTFKMDGTYLSAPSMLAQDRE